MAWKLIISEGASELEITDDSDFNLSVVPQYNERGFVDYVEYTIQIDGNVVLSSASLIANRIVQLSQEASVNLLPRRVRLQLDGVNKYDFLPSQSFASPRVQAFITRESDGSGESHWRFNGVVYVKQRGNNLAGLIELNSWIRVEKNVHNKIVRKTWHVSAKHRTAALALAAVLAFKPNHPFITESIQRFFQEAMVIAEWVWEMTLINVDPSNPIGVGWIEEEPIEVTDLGERWVEDTQAKVSPTAAAEPILHPAVDRAAMVVVRGFIVALSDQITAPPLHFVESAEMVLAPGRGRKFFPAIHDPAAGTWKLSYEEVWLFTGTAGTLPTPNHGTHSGVTLQAPAPADGGMVQ